MIAARMGHSHVVRLLLKKGADVAAESSENFAAILGAVRGGYVAVTEILLQAGADSEVTGPGGLTPLMVAALHGYSEVTRVLIKAGANVDSRASGEETPLFFAAGVGRADVVKQLLRAKADPLLAATVVDDESLVLPLGAAAAKGHLNIVRELVQQVGIAGCGGASGGVNALRWAAQGRHLDVVVMLTEEGVVDTGLAFVDAVRAGDKRCVKFLLQQQQGKPGEAAYVLLQLLHVCLLSCCPRLMRLLIDAGGNPASTMRVSTTEGVAVLDHTPLDIVEISLRDKVFDEKPATEEQLLKLEALRRLLLQVDAVHATSWLWQRYVSSTSGVSEACRRTRAAPTHLATVLPIVRRRATRRGVLLAALCRWALPWCSDLILLVSKWRNTWPSDNIAAAAIAAVPVSEPSRIPVTGGGSALVAR